MTEQLTIPCPICTEPLRFTVTTNRNGKHAIGLHCPKDGRHFRGFINHKPFVDEALGRLAEAMSNGAAPSDPALQKTSEGPSPAKTTHRKAQS